MKRHIAKNLSRSIVFIILFVILYKCTAIAIVDTNSTTRLAYHDFYCQDNIDVAVAGSSRVLRGFQPQLADERLGINTFNLGTSSQTLDGTYYYIRELLSNYDVDTVFLAVEFAVLARDVGDQKTTWIMTDYMRGINKYRFIFDVFDYSQWPIMLFDVYRYKNDINYEYCMTNLKAKLTPHYWNYDNYSDYYSNYESYIGKGFAVAEKENVGYDYFCYPEAYGEFDIVSSEDYRDEEIEYLRKAIELCQSKGVEIVLITMPDTDFYIRHAGNYSDFHSIVSTISDEYQIEYYDFNLLADDDFSDSEFANLDHLTMAGAEHFTEILCDIYTDRNSHLFFASPNEAVSEGIIGITYSTESLDTGEKLLTWDVETINDEKFVYRIEKYASEEGEIEFDSGFIFENSITGNFDSHSIIEIQVYDSEGSYLGKAKFLNFK